MSNAVHLDLWLVAALDRLDNFTTLLSNWFQTKMVDASSVAAKAGAILCLKKHSEEETLNAASHRRGDLATSEALIRKSSRDRQTGFIFSHTSIPQALHPNGVASVR